MKIWPFHHSRTSSILNKCVGMIGRNSLCFYQTRSDMYYPQSGIEVGFDSGKCPSCPVSSKHASTWRQSLTISSQRESTNWGCGRPTYAAIRGFSAANAGPNIPGASRLFPLWLCLDFWGPNWIAPSLLGWSTSIGACSRSWSIAVNLRTHGAIFSDEFISYASPGQMVSASKALVPQTPHPRFHTDIKPSLEDSQRIREMCMQQEEGFKHSMLQFWAFQTTEDVANLCDCVLQSFIHGDCCETVDYWDSLHSPHNQVAQSAEAPVSRAYLSSVCADDSAPAGEALATSIDTLSSKHAPSNLQAWESYLHLSTGLQAGTINQSNTWTESREKIARNLAIRIRNMTCRLDSSKLHQINKRSYSSYSQRVTLLFDQFPFWSQSESLYSQLAACEYEIVWRAY